MKSAVKKIGLITILLSLLILSIDSFILNRKKPIDKPEKIINGKLILEIQQGKDGSVWQLQASNKELYNATISFPNLVNKENRKDFFCLEKGTSVQIVGDIGNSDRRKRITVRNLKILSHNSKISMLKCQIKSQLKRILLLF